MNFNFLSMTCIKNFLFFLQGFLGLKMLPFFIVALQQLKCFFLLLAARPLMVTDIDIFFFKFFLLKICRILWE